MPDAPLITVVTPSLNQGDYLDECIRSVFEQHYPNLQYLIIDGGSTDQSVDVIKSFEDRLAYWVSEEDAGQSNAINKGIAQAAQLRPTPADGELVAWLNADDAYAPGALNAIAQAYLSSPDAAFYYGNASMIHADGQSFDLFRPRKQPLIFRRDALLWGLNFIPQPATFIPRKHWDAVGGLDEALHWGLDTDLWLRLSELADPIILPQVLAHMRIHEKAKTETGGFARVEELRRIASKHSAVDITPGVICYWLDTLLTHAENNKDLYDWRFRKALGWMWRQTSSLMKSFGADETGHPRREMDETKDASG